MPCCFCCRRAQQAAAEHAAALARAAEQQQVAVAELRSEMQGQLDAAAADAGALVQQAAELQRRLGRCGA